MLLLLYIIILLGYMFFLFLTWNILDIILIDNKEKSSNKCDLSEP